MTYSDSVELGLDNPAFANGHVEPERLNQKSSKEEAQEKAAAERGAWGGKLEFILTCIGYAVGLGNVWRFPYLCYKNGGGAFLIPYILMLLMVGLPMFYFELCFGQFSSLGPIKIWLVSPMFKGVGFAMVCISLMVGLSYNIIITWSLYYFVNAMTVDFPWASCNNTFNNEKCLTFDEFKLVIGNETIKNQTLTERGLEFTELETASEQFFYDGVLDMSEGIHDMGVPVWGLLLCLLFSWTLIFLVLIKGIQSLGKVVYVVAIFPYILITILLVFSCTLEGALDGILFYIKPDFNRLWDAEVWSDAATQIFYSLSACTGGLIAMSSYNNFNNNVYRDSLIVPFINCFTSFYSGFAVFAVLGFMAHSKGVEVKDVADAGPGLVFIAYPEALSQMPIPTLWSILFFLMLIMLGFSSEFSIIEAIFVAIMDEFPGVLRKNKWRPVIFRGVCCLIFFAITIPMITNGGFYLFTLVDNAAGGFPLLIIGFFEVIAVNWAYGFDRFANDIAMMIGKRPNIYFRVTWVALTPLILIVITGFKAYQHVPLHLGAYEYPDWGNAIYWLILAFCVIWIPLIAMYMICTRGGWKVVKQVTAPRKRWGPALSENRTGIYAPKSEPKIEPIQNEKLPMPEISYTNGNGYNINGNGYDNSVEIRTEL